MSQKILDVVKPGVVTGEDVQKVFAICKENKFAMPAVNVINTDSINNCHSGVVVDKNLRETIILDIDCNCYGFAGITTYNYPYKFN